MTGDLIFDSAGRQLVTLDDFAVNPEMQAALRKPFDPKQILKLPATEKRPSLDYVSHAAVTDRLNQVAPGWTMSEPKFILTAEGHVVAVIASMTIGSVTRWEVGDVDRLSSYGDEAKKAMSNWIRRAAMRFGVALDLWAKEDLSAEPAVLSPDRSSTPADNGGGDPNSKPGTSNTPAALSDPEGPPAGTIAYGEGAASTSGSDSSLASAMQWKNLSDAMDGNKTKMLNYVRRASGINYKTLAEAQSKATREDLTNAILGNRHEP